MKPILSPIAAGLVGAVFGVLSNRSILEGSWLNLILWAVVGILIGLFIEDKHYVNRAGISYGFFVTLAFLVSQFQGTPDKIFSFALLTAVLCLFGAFCGWFWVFTSNWVKRKLQGV